MPTASEPVTFAALSTPAVLINTEIVAANIQRYQNYSNHHGLKLRPHCKTHKLPYLAKQQLAAGAVGITCQKLAEAEVMADHGINDILLTYNIIGDSKLQRLRQLSNRVAKLAVVADNQQVVTGLSAAFATHSKSLAVMVECETGMQRCGVTDPNSAAQMAQTISTAEGLEFAGLMTYPGVGHTLQVEQFMQQTLALLRTANLACPIISSGGSPNMWQAHLAPCVNEYRVGTYIYNDTTLAEAGVCSWEDCALTILATVISCPTSDRAVIDCGSKTLSSDKCRASSLFTPLPALEPTSTSTLAPVLATDTSQRQILPPRLTGFGRIINHPEITIDRLSEEHGVLTAPTTLNLTVGQRVQIIPNHCCVVSNLCNQVYLYHGESVPQATPVVARGCVT